MPMMVLSTQKTSAPTVPTGLIATAVSTSQIDLSWTAASNVSGCVLVGYKLYRDGAFLTNVATPTLTYSDTGLSSSTLYTYTVSAYTTKAESARSSSANATTQSSGGGVTDDVTVEGSGTQWVTFGSTFAVGEITNTPFLAPTAGGSVTHQAVIQARHPDNSVRHAVFSAQVTGGVTYDISNGSPPGGANKTVADLLAAVAGNIAHVNLTGGLTATVIVRDLLESATNRAKLNNTSSYYVFEQGPQMLGVVVSQDVSTHLRVTMHLRWYGGTTLWCDYLFERGYCNLNGMNSASYTAELVLNGVSKSTTVLSPHYNRTMWHKAFWSTGGTLYPRLNGEALIASKAVPNYDMTQAPGTPYLNGLRSSTAPMDNGDNTDDLDDTGYQPSLGILARWDASFLTSDCDSRNYACVLANADGGMAYNYSCAMDSVTGEMVSISDHTTFTDQGDVGLGTGWTSGLSPFDAGVTGQPAAHNMSVGYLAYVLTGQWSFLRAMHSWASFLPLWVNSTRNISYAGVTVRRFYGGSVRGVGWSYRTVGQAAYITPDSHYLKSYYTNTINGAFGADGVEFDATYSAIGLVESAEVSADGPDQYRNFMHNFLAQAVCHLVCDLGFTSGLTFARHVSTFVAGLMGNDGAFKWNFAASYIKTIGTGSAQANWYTTFTQVNASTDNVPSYATSLAAGSQALANAMFSAGDIPSATAGSITGRPDDPTSYYANMQPAVSYLQALGVPAASTCWTRYVTGTTPAYNDTPQFSIKPRSTTTLAQYAALIQPGQCIRVPITISDSQVRDGTSPVFKWASSACWDPISRRVMIVCKREDAGHAFKFWTYVESSNTCGFIAFPPESSNLSGHGYDHNAIDEQRGKFFTRLYNDTSGPYQLYQGSWSQLGAIGGAVSFASSLTFVPTIGNQGSLLTVDPVRIRALNMQTQTWSVLKSLGGADNNHSVSEYNRNSNYLIFGGGNNGAAMSKMDCSSLVVSAINTPPFNCGSSETQGVLCEDPAGTGFIACEKGTSNWAHCNPTTGVWTTLTQSTGNGASAQTGLPNLTTGAGDAGYARIAAPIGTYGVTLWVEYVGGSEIAKIWLYRHS
jgi:hypothetical protein